MALYGGIEAGGTKMVVAVSNNLGKIEKRAEIQTETPDISIPKIISFFNEIHKKNPIAAIGIASFGPIDAHKSSSHYGCITTTPKKGWNNFNIVAAIKNKFKVPIGFDTDVNGAALGEHRYGAGKNLDTFIYITVGTGIGVGAMAEKKLMHGLIHPEMGHILMPLYPNDTFEGVCPFHKNCLEALASGPAMQKRWNLSKATDLPKNHEGWEIEAFYLGAAICNYIMCISPQKVIIGGGVMQNDLIVKIRKNVQKLLNGYIKHPLIDKDIDNYIVLPKLLPNSGIFGAIALAEQAYMEQK